MLKGAIKQIDEDIIKLKKKRQQLAFQLVLSCKHEHIISTDRMGYPWSRHDSVKCLHCGVGVNGNGCGVFDTPLLSFKNSRIVERKNSDELINTFHADDEVAYALCHPRRYELQYLKRIFDDNTPWTAKEVLEKDTQRYSILRELYVDYNDWHNDTYVKD